MRVGLTEFTLLWILIITGGCHATNYAERGATLGALTGALGGAAIGQHNGDAASGAIIGTAVGALAGTAIGDTIDYEAARSAEIIEQRMGRRMAGAVAMNDVIAMTQAGLSDEVIATHMRANGVASPPSVNDLITLRNAGVSDTVIQTMQQTPPPTAQVSSPTVISQPGPVIIEEHHYVAPPFPYRYHYGPHRRPGVHWGVSFGR
ncbi:MAG: hypothetical protein H6822_12070 [Planctomycetaceae bacterium]|nr:hypothetical protein [Planctomycetales bacterium]MCB9922913.1 hypothetical protein [Planctomycetaceae bacterium]